MTHGIRRSVLVATLAVCLGALGAYANMEEVQDEDQGDTLVRYAYKGKGKSKGKNGDYWEEENREHDRRGEIMRLPGRSADEAARDGIGPSYERRPATWVDTGPETDVDSQIQVLDGLMGPQDPAIVEDGEAATTSGDVSKGTFSDSNGDEWNYCSGKCIRNLQKIPRAGGAVDKIIRVKKGTCTCSCVLFKTTGKKPVNSLEVDGDSGYLNINQGNPADYSLRCCEED